MNGWHANTINPDVSGRAKKKSSKGSSKAQSKGGKSCERPLSDMAAQIVELGLGINFSIISIS